MGQTQAHQHQPQHQHQHQHQQSARGSGCAEEGARQDSDGDFLTADPGTSEPATSSAEVKLCCNFLIFRSAQIDLYFIDEKTLPATVEPHGESPAEGEEGGGADPRQQQQEQQQEHRLTAADLESLNEYYRRMLNPQDATDSDHKG